MRSTDVESMPVMERSRTTSMVTRSPESASGSNSRPTAEAGAQSAVLGGRDETGAFDGVDTGQGSVAIGHRDLVDGCAVGDDVGFDADLAGRVFEPEGANRSKGGDSGTAVPRLPGYPRWEEVAEVRCQRRV